MVETPSIANNRLLSKLPQKFLAFCSHSIRYSMYSFNLTSIKLHEIFCRVFIFKLLKTLTEFIQIYSTSFDSTLFDSPDFTRLHSTTPTHFNSSDSIRLLRHNLTPPTQFDSSDRIRIHSNPFESIQIHSISFKSIRLLRIHPSPFNSINYAVSSIHFLVNL